MVATCSVAVSFLERKSYHSYSNKGTYTLVYTVLADVLLYITYIYMEVYTYVRCARTFGVARGHPGTKNAVPT